MAGLSGQQWSVVATLRCFKMHGWSLGRVKMDSRLARNGETAVLAYQRPEVPERCFFRQATRALHFAALAPLRRRWGLSRPGQLQGIAVGSCRIEAESDNQQCRRAGCSHDRNSFLISIRDPVGRCSRIASVAQSRRLGRR